MPERVFRLLCTLTCALSFLSRAWAADAAVEIHVVPRPREFEALGAGFDPTVARFIRVSDTPEDRFAAGLLQGSLQETHGIECDVEATPQSPGGGRELWLYSGAQVAPAPPPKVPAGREKEGYTLRVGEGGVRIAAASAAGLYYGVQTLIQLLEQSARDNGEMPGMAIVDYPEFGTRQRYFDGAQYAGTIVLTRPNLEQAIKRLARYKLNYLIIEIYNFAPFKSFPSGADGYTLPLSDWEYLVELAHQHHVTIMPSFQSLGQAYMIWRCDEGKPYRESTCQPLICPSRPENAKFLEGLYKDLLEIFKYTPYLGIGCSEIKLQWQGRHCPTCRKRLDDGESVKDIFCDHVNRCAVAVEAAGKALDRSVRPWMWADEFYGGYEGERWEGLERISKNVVMGHWAYWSTYWVPIDPMPKDYDGIEGLLQRGFDVSFLSASYKYNAYLHDLSPDDPKSLKPPHALDAGIFNIAAQPRWAYIYNGKGYQGKVLGGGCATFSQHDIRSWDTTWYAFMLHADYAWGDPTRPLTKERLEQFTRDFVALFYGALDAYTIDALNDVYFDLDAAKSEIERTNYLIRDVIGEYDNQDSYYAGNDLNDSLKLIETLIAQERHQTLDCIHHRSERIIKVAEKCREKLSTPAVRVRNTESLEYLQTAAHKIQNHAVRTNLLLDLQGALRQVPDAKDEQSRNGLRQQIEGLQKRLADLIADSQLILDKVGHLVTSGDGTGYGKVMSDLGGIARRLDAALKDLGLAATAQE